MTLLDGPPKVPVPDRPVRVAAAADTDDADPIVRLNREMAVRHRTGAHAQSAPRDRLTARDRIDLLTDPGTFQEVGGFRRHRASGFGLERHRPYTDGVVSGWGQIHGRRVMIYAQDSGVFGGSLGEAQAEKIQKVMDLAISALVPVIAINDGGGARIQEGVRSLAGYGRIFQRQVLASGLIPQISIVLGACAGGAAYGPALSDFVFAVDGTSHLFVTGPDVLRAVTGECVTKEALGGTKVHGRTGVVSFVYPDELSCIADVRYLLTLLPSSCDEAPEEYLADDPADRDTSRLQSLVPADPKQPYDVTEVVAEIMDDNEHLQFAQAWAPNIVCSLGRMGGSTVGVVANQPIVAAGALDARASEKAARFITLCDAFNIPLVTLVDVPGFLPGVAQEHHGLIRHGAKLLYAYSNATVPRIQVIMRKAYGGAYIVMDSPSIGCDLSFAWPDNEIAVMGAEGAASIVFRRQIELSPDPSATRERLAAEYRQQLSNSFHAAEQGLVDEVIDPRDTRATVIEALTMLRNKCVTRPERRKHGNYPI